MRIAVLSEGILLYYLEELENSDFASPDSTYSLFSSNWQESIQPKETLSYSHSLERTIDVKIFQDSGKSHLMITESVAHAILKKCGATRRHALTCVDYFVSAGLDAFEDLDDILDTLVKNALIDPDMFKLMKQSLLRSKAYLRTDYKVAYILHS